MTDTDPDERSPATEASESATELSPLLTALRETEERHNGDAVAGSTREREQLLRAVAEAVVTEPAAAVDGEPFDASVGGLARDLGREAQRTVARALSAAAADRADTIAREIDTVRPLLDTDDPVVAAWVAGTLGRVAETHADAVAPAAMDLAALAEHENRTVRHNAVEALAAVAQECPGAVAPAACRNPAQRNRCLRRPRSDASGRGHAGRRDDRGPQEPRRTGSTAGRSRDTRETRTGTVRRRRERDRLRR
jgi:hypothetical protein